MKLKNQEDEALWLRTRVGDLQEMVRTQRKPMEGSLEVRDDVGEPDAGDLRDGMEASGLRELPKAERQETPT